MYKLIIAILLLISVTTAFSQSGSIKGLIIDKTTNSPIPYANVIVVGTNNLGSTSDSTGNFRISNIPKGVYVLKVSFIGYSMKQIPNIEVIDGKTKFLNIELEENNQELGEVTIVSYRYENVSTMPVSTYSFSRDEISTNPGAQGDIMRAIGMLPGVTSSGGAFSAISVRGQGTRDNAYFVDDIPVFSLAHLEGSPNGFNDPNGGRFSIFAPRVINSAVFQGGGFSTQFGRRSSSYLGLSIKEGNKESFIVDGQLDLLGATINYDGPSYFHKKTQLFVSARFQDLTPVIKMANLEDLGVPKYQDFVFKSTTELNKKNKLNIIGVYSPETFVRDTSNVRADENLNRLFIIDRESQQLILGAKLTSRIGEMSKWRNLLYYNNTESESTYGKAFPTIGADGKLLPNSSIPFEDKIRDIKYAEKILGYRSILTHRINEKSKITAGIDFDKVWLSSYRNLSRPDTLMVYTTEDIKPFPGAKYTVVLPQYFNMDKSISSANASAYVDYNVVIKKFSANIGLRTDYTGFTEEFNVSPRLSGAYNISEKQRISFATGLFYQDPIYSEIADQDNASQLKNMQVFNSIIGYQYFFKPSLKFTAEGWYKKMNNTLVRPQSGAISLNSNGQGYAYGVDINLTKKLTDKFHGQIGYSYMVSKRNDNDSYGEYDYTFSQPNQFNLLLSYRLKKKWMFSGKVRYATGKPTPEYVINENVFPSGTSIYQYSQEITSKGGQRLPDFISFDIRVDYKFNINKIGFTAFVDIVNINNRLNANQELFNPLSGETYYDGISVFPTFGLKFKF